MDLLYFDRPSQHIQMDSKVITISVDFIANQVHLPFLLPSLPLLKSERLTFGNAKLKSMVQVIVLFLDAYPCIELQVTVSCAFGSNPPCIQIFSYKSMPAFQSRFSLSESVIFSASEAAGNQAAAHDARRVEERNLGDTH
jgi:hypothetical protein